VILRLALRSLAAQPVRSAVLALGFGVGIAAMAGLLGVGEVILEQSRAPALAGGGDVFVTGPGGELPNARFVLASLLGAGELAPRVAAAAPRIQDSLVLVDPRGGTHPVWARAGVPSLERGLGDPETAHAAAWVDTPADVAWASPEPAAVLRAMDRFHVPPQSAAWHDSWAEWLYFNGGSSAARFYLTFLFGAETSPGRRWALVRLQLERDGRMTNWSEAREVAAPELLDRAPDVVVGASSVRLEGLRYRLRVDLPEENGGSRRVTGELTLDAVPGRSLPPFVIRGAGGWVSGYTAPVLSGPLGGMLRVGDASLSLDGEVGYHDHNWGFWEGVTWRWGQVAHDGLSLVYGRIFPPPDVADPARLPGLLVALGPEGPLGYSMGLKIEEERDAAERPLRLRVQAQSTSLDLALDLDVEEVAATALRGPFEREGAAPAELLQLRARYRVRGTIGDRPVDFEARGSAETFRGARSGVQSRLSSVSSR
jgi:hypothetical protein